LPEWLPGTLVTMSIDSDAVLREALGLPTPERAAVAAELLASLDDAAAEDPEAVRDAWAEELERRAQRARSGDDACQPWPDLRDRLRNKLAR
jgi:putative addiction module component (TIGR02574 family)